VSTYGDDRSEAGRYLQALRDHWILIAWLVVLGVVVATLYSQTASKRYEAHADLLVSPIPGDDDTFVGINVLKESGDPTRSVITAARLLKSGEVVRGVARRLRIPESELQGVEVKPLGQANIVTITAESTSASTAARIANAFAEETIAGRTRDFQADLADTIDRLRSQVRAIPAGRRNIGEALAIQERLAALTPLIDSDDPTLQISSRATAPGSPVWPRPALSIAVAFIGALLIGMAAAIALELGDPRVRREEELLLSQRLPILARVPRLPRRVVRDYLSGMRTLTPDVWDSYRGLLANLSVLGELPRTIVVTSAGPAEGKTITAVNLAVTLASRGTRVVLVDGDVRRPMVASVFGVAAQPGGFADLVATGEIGPRTLVPAPGELDSLELVLASPEKVDDRDYFFDPRTVARALALLQEETEVVIIDSPPLTEVPDALTLAAAADAVLIAVRLGRTRRDKLNELRRQLAQRGIAAAGFVVTTRQQSRSPGYYQRPKRPGATPRDDLPAAPAPDRRSSSREA
jgi:Mrp family chromosome partitioning ATPase/capsular polysaccharide biosynthesis protein